MAAGFDLGSIFSTLDLDFSGFLKGIERAQSSITSIKQDFESLAKSAQQSFDQVGRSAEAAATRMQTAFTQAARGAAQGAANAAAAAGIAVQEAVTSTRAGAGIIPFTAQPVPIGPMAPPAVPSIPTPALAPSSFAGNATAQALAGSFTFQSLAGLTTNSTAALNALTASVRNAPTAWQAFGASARAAFANIGTFAQQANTQFSTLGASLLNFRTILATIGVMKLVGVVAGFDQKIAEMRSVMQEIPGFRGEAGIGRMRQEALKLGATTIFGPSESAGAMTELARAGFDESQVLSMIVPTLQLASIEHLNLDQTVKIVTKTLNTFNLEASETRRVTDVIAKAATLSQTSIAGIGAAFLNVGPLAANLGMTLENTAAAFAAISGKIQDRGAMGTGLRAIFTGITQDVPKHNRVLASMGLTLDDIDVRLLRARGSLTPFTDAMQKFKDAGMNATQALALFRANGANVAIALTDNIEELRKFELEMAKANGTTERMATTATNNLKDAFTQLSNVMQVAFIQLGDTGFTGGLRSMVDGLTNAIRAMTGFIDPLSAAAPVAYQLAAALQGLLTILAGLAAIKLYTVFAGFVAANPQLAALALAIGAIVTVYGLLTGESQRFAQAQANVNNLIERMAALTVTTSSTVIAATRAEADALIAKERVALAALAPTPEGFTKEERPLLGSGMKLPFGVEVPGLQTYNEEAAAKRATLLATDPRAKQLQDNIARMEAARATMPAGVTPPKSGEPPYDPYRDTKDGADKAARAAFQTQKQGVEALLEKHRADTQLLQTRQHVEEALVQYGKDDVGLAELKARHQQRLLDLQELQNAEAQVEYELLLKKATTEAQRVDAKGHLDKLTIQQEQLPLARDLATVQGRISVDTAKEARERSGMADDLARTQTSFQQMESLAQASGQQAMDQRQALQEYALEGMRRRGGNTELQEQALQEKMAYDQAYDRFFLEAQLYDLRVRGANEELALLQDKQAHLEHYNLSLKEQADLEMEIRRAQGKVDTLAASAPRAPMLQPPRTMEQLAADRFAGNMGNALQAGMQALFQGDQDNERRTQAQNELAGRQRLLQQEMALQRERISFTLTQGKDVTALQHELTNLEKNADNLAKQRRELTQEMQSTGQQIVQAIGRMFSGMGQSLLQSAIPNFGKAFQSSMKDLFPKMSESTATWIQAGAGAVITGIGYLMGKQKADVQQLGDDVKNNIESVEKTRGLIAGEQNVAVQQLSGQLGQALRPTVEVLMRMESLLRMLVAAETGQPVGDVQSGYAITNQLYASELLGSARLS